MHHYAQIYIEATSLSRFPLIRLPPGNHLPEQPDALRLLFRPLVAEIEPEAVIEPAGGRAEGAGDDGDVVRPRLLEQKPGVDALRQLDPEAEAALGAGDAGAGGKGLGHGGDQLCQLFLEAVAHAPKVAFIGAAV